MDEDEVVNMYMKAKREIDESEKITPLMEPIASCLHYSRLSTHCSGCFRRLNWNMIELKSGFVRYCSSKCASVDSPIYFGSGEHELLLLLRADPDLWPFHDFRHQDVSYLRLALRFIRLLPPTPPGPLLYARSGPYVPFPPRILGISYNCPDSFVFIERGAWIMNQARAMRTGATFYGTPDLGLDRKVLTLVITNALRVSLDTPIPDGLGPLYDPVPFDNNPIGVALYDYRISLINHSCAPNSCVSFVNAFPPNAYDDYEPNANDDYEDDNEDFELPIEGDCVDDLVELVGLGAPLKVSGLLKGQPSIGPRAAVKTLTRVQKGEEVTISYVDSSLPLEARHRTLTRDYRFSCSC